MPKEVPLVLTLTFSQPYYYYYSLTIPLTIAHITNQQQIITATAGQTVFDLSFDYQPGTNSLSVFVDGVNQYGPGAQYAYTETDSNTVTFVSGLHVGAVVKFTTTQQQGAGAVNASQVTYNPAGTGAVATNVQAKLRQTVSVKDYGAVGNGATNDTAAIQAAITDTAAGGALYFPPGVYLIDSLDTGLIESTWFFDSATLKANSNAAQTHLLKFQGRHCNIYNLRINMNFKTNYDSALWWYNSANASQFNNFYGMEIRYAKRGIVYGAFPGTSSNSLAQSENSLFGYVSYGVERPFLSNHLNGVISLVSCTLSAQDQDWTSGFDYTINRAFQVLAGSVYINGGEIQNTIADVTAYAASVEGGVVFLNNVNTEVDVPFSVSGQLYISGGRIQNTQSVTSQFYIAAAADSTTRLRVNDCKIYRQPTVGSFSNKPLIDNSGSSQNIDISFSSCEIAEWASFVPIGSNQQSIRFIDCKYYPDGSLDPYYAVYLLNTDGANLLDRPNIDTKGYTTNGFYFEPTSGSGSMALNANVPTIYYANSLSVIATGTCWVSTADPTSLTTIKNTAFPVTVFDKFMIEGWFKIASGTQGAVGLALYNSAGAYTAALDAFTQNNGELSTSWKYLRAIVQIPSGSTGAYAGFGIRGQTSTILMAGLKVRRADWNVN